MAVGDVYSLSCQMTLVDSPATVNFHYQEVTASDGSGVPAQRLAAAWNAATVSEDMRSLLSNDVQMTGVLVRKLGSPFGPPGLDTQNRPGANTGPALPANDGLRVGILQSVFPSRSNGLVWIPGIRELDCNGNTFTTAFMNGAVATFVASLGLLVEETPNTGQWRLGVLSRKYLELNPGDYAGAFADAVGASASPIVGSQRRRTTKRRGAPGAVV